MPNLLLQNVNIYGRTNIVLDHKTAFTAMITARDMAAEGS
jgi:hypothetical protein